LSHFSFDFSKNVKARCFFRLSSFPRCCCCCRYFFVVTSFSVKARLNQSLFVRPVSLSKELLTEIAFVRTILVFFRRRRNRGATAPSLSLTYLLAPTFCICRYTHRSHPSPTPNAPHPSVTHALKEREREREIHCLLNCQHLAYCPFGFELRKRGRGKRGSKITIPSSDIYPLSLTHTRTHALPHTHFFKTKRRRDYASTFDCPTCVQL